MPRRSPTLAASGVLRQTTQAPPSVVGVSITSTFAASNRARQFFCGRVSTHPLDRGERSHVFRRKCAPLQTRVFGAWFAQGEATMTKLAASLGLGALLLSAAPASACPAERAAFTESTPVRFAAWTIPVAAGDDEDGLSEATIAAVED